MPKETDPALLAVEESLNTPFEGEEKFAAAAGDDEAAQARATSAARLLAKAKEELGEDALRDLIADAGFGHAKAAPVKKTDEKPENKPNPEPKPKEKSEETPEVVTKADLDGLLKRHDEELGKRDKRIDDLVKKDKARDEADDDRQVAEMVAKYATPGDRKTTTKLVKSMDPDQRAMWVEGQKSGRAAVEQLTREIGTSHAAPVADSAEAHVLKSVDEAIAKSEGELTMDGARAAFAAAEKEQPGAWDAARRGE